VSAGIAGAGVPGVANSASLASQRATFASCTFFAARYGFARIALLAFFASSSVSSRSIQSISAMMSRRA
jgi:hypothetical protein